MQPPLPGTSLVLVLCCAAAGCSQSKSASVAPRASGGAANEPGAMPGSSPTAAACDTSTDAAQHAVYTQVTGLPFVPAEGHFYDQTCLSASPTFRGLLTTGSFATEVGCEWQSDIAPDDPTTTIAWEGVIFDCRFSRRAADVAAAAMARAGWPSAAGAQRGKLAWAWVGEVMHLDPVDTAPDHFEHGKKFTPPTATPAAGGGLLLTFWTANPTMGRGESYTEHALTFSPAGVPGELVHVDDAGTP